jgi:transcriptional regulator of acetoin/glycerol metabolism
VTISTEPRTGYTAHEPSLDREELIAALNRCHWNHGRAAESLGISRTTLWRKLREFQVGA